MQRCGSCVVCGHGLWGTPGVEKEGRNGAHGSLVTTIMRVELPNLVQKWPCSETPENIEACRRFSARGRDAPLSALPELAHSLTPLALAFGGL